MRISIVRSNPAKSVLMLGLAACSTGGVLGGVAGGVAGNKLGNGSTVATIGGAAAGAVIGDQIQKRM